MGKRGFNTQPPEGGWFFARPRFIDMDVSTHSRPKAAGTVKCSAKRSRIKFQHTAARRRLEQCYGNDERLCVVSTHSRPKAAGRFGDFAVFVKYRFQHTAARRRLGQQAVKFQDGSGFNTQPPEGGWLRRCRRRV